MTEWRKVKGFETYEVSNHGEVRNTETGLLLKQTINTGGYPSVVLYSDGLRKCRTVHRLVALAFVPRDSDCLEVNHIDEDKTNNNAENLVWVTKKENINHGTRTKRANQKKYKRVAQCSLGGEIVKVWDSVKDAERYGFHHSAISECCYGKRETHFGYVWRYAV